MSHKILSAHYFMINIRKTGQCSERNLITSGYNKDRAESLITTGRLIQSVACAVKMLLLVHCYKKACFKIFHKKKLVFSDSGRLIEMVKKQLTKDRSTPQS